MKFDITYIYSGGRAKKINTNSSGEFFYGFKEYLNMGKNVTFIELSSKKTSIFDKLIVKITKLPVYLIKSISLKNFRVLTNSKNLIFINESSFISFLPFIIICKKFYKPNVIFFPMGLVDKYLEGNWLSKKIINLSFKFADSVLFIGKGEQLYAEKNFSNYSNKFSYIPFSIDIGYWVYKPKIQPRLKELLFIGNDQNRDFKLLFSIAKTHQDYNFTIVSNFDNNNFSDLQNVKFLQGNLRDDILSDNQILELYHNADLVILPLKTSTQPSGQSVAIQSMSSGTPVLMTKTKGFWDIGKYIDSKNIFFVNTQSLEDWDISLKKISNNLSSIVEVSARGRKVVEENHDLNNFVVNLDHYLVEI